MTLAEDRASFWTDRRLLAALGVAGALATIALRWPGALTVDSTNQLRQAVSGHFTDWHPPLMAFVWRFLGSSPEAMFVLQVVTFWTGLALVANAVRSRWPLIVGLSPIVLHYLGVIGKDTLLASVLMLGAGLVASGWRRWGAVTIIAAGFLRANAGFAIGPLLLAGRKRLWTPFLGVAMIGLVALSSATVQRTGVERGLPLYDLAGIDHFSEGGSFPERCYTPLFWDTLGTPRCGNAFQQIDRNITAEWLMTIAKHPIAYAQHRIAHFNRSLFFIVPPAQQCVEAAEMHDCPVSIRGDFLTKNAFFWPCVWLAVGFALLLGPNIGPLATGLIWSGLAYGLSYAVVGVASDFRYFLWTEISVQLAAVLALVRGASIRWPLIAAGAVAALGYLARLAYLL